MPHAEVYINVGALDYLSGDRFQTKSALKRAVDEKSDVIFDQTAMIHSDILPGHIDLRDLLDLTMRTKDWRLSVVGPDPYNSRRWYATVYPAKDGTIKVK